MQNAPNRSVVVISGLLTLLVLGVAMMTLAFRNGWVQVAPAAPRGADVTPVTQSAAADAVASRLDGVAPGADQPAGIAPRADQDELAAYRGKLEESYRALDEAYAQVRALQAAQSQVSSRGERGEREHESEHRDGRHERKSRYRDADND